MMRLFPAAIFFVFLAENFINLASATECYNASFYTNSTFGNDSFVFPFGDSATISIIISCDFDYHYFSFYWERLTGRELLWDIETMDDDVSVWSFSADHIKLSSNFSQSDLHVTITFAKLEYKANQSKIYFLDYYSGYENKSPRITILCCDRTMDLLNFTTTMNGEHCADEAVGVCREGSAFHSITGEYMSSVKVRCESAAWSGEFQCLKSCPTPQQSNFNALNASQRHKINSHLTTKCVRGRMYTKNAPRRFLEETKISCLESETWEYQEEVDCWEGSFVDFLSENITVTSGENVIFTCETRSPLEAAMQVLDEKFRGNETTWANITMTPDHNGISASCSAVNRSDQWILSERKTYLNVLYVAEVIGGVDQIYEFNLGTPGHVIVPFRANPSIGLEDIIVLKNGTEISNYYLEFDGSSQKIVLDFDKVSEEDFGDYVITVMSNISVKSTLIIELTVGLSASKSLQFHEPSAGDISAIVLAVVLVTSLAAAGFAYYKLSKRNASNTHDRDVKINKAYEDSSPHNYEDMPSADQHRYQPSPQSGYVNIAVPAPASSQRQMKEKMFQNQPESVYEC